MFGFGKKKPAPKTMPRRPVPGGGGGEKRTAFRMPVEFPVFYTLSGRRGRRSATANDLSAGGLRLIADEDFIKGSTLLLQFKVPDDFLANMTIDKEGYEDTPFGKRPKASKSHPPPFGEFKVNAKALVTFFDLRRRKFAFGIAFDHIDVSVTEELQRFIHLWQLNQLRIRNQD